MMERAKPVLDYAPPRQSAAGTLSGGTVKVVAANSALGLTLFTFSAAHSWGWDVFILGSGLFAICFVRAVVAFLMVGRIVVGGTLWVRLFFAAAGPLLTGAATWHAWTSAHGC